LRNTSLLIEDEEPEEEEASDILSRFGRWLRAFIP